MFLFAIHQLCPDTLEPYAPFLSPERWHRAGAFRREADQLRCVAAGLLGNFCLWQWCGGRPMALRKNRYGKPFLEGSPVQFSLSHAGDWAVCGLADCPLGVDIEKVQPVERGMYELCLTPQERQQLEQAPMPPERRFIQLWTLKESLGKLRGDGRNRWKGMPAVPSSVTFRPANPAPAGSPSRWGRTTASLSACRRSERCVLR